ncbi:LSU ribosomal protein L4P [Panacagrimonas perspica]|uniref:Large ribosomal subunit protein uL4 n=1 Tax=Panacagrimonas perspica TaxID=381431 RepID=A0A4R7P3E9_9GAMM|nr:50S ribosomal protein L4 [Panacagrimonas perspica]TDU28118.1 LSU ribosomal protein L4P [Panacagrimonas perspica]THD03529.1 50S ribosomal protein L4 [Panacagrimonas perspica]
MEIQVHNSSTKVSVNDAVFAAEYNEPLIHQVVTAYMNGGRAGTKKQKTKAEVSGGGKKPWKQKGTGQARAGSIRSPLWRGGGKTHAAVPRDFSQKVNRKMYRGAIRSIVSELARAGHLMVTDTLAVEAAKTKTLIEKLKDYGTNDVLLVTGEVDQNLYLSARNLHKVGVTDVSGLDPVSLLRHSKVVLTTDAVKKLEAWLS